MLGKTKPKHCTKNYRSLILIWYCFTTKFFFFFFPSNCSFAYGWLFQPMGKQAVLYRLPYCLEYGNMGPAPTSPHLWQGQLFRQLFLPHWARKELEYVGSSYLEGKGRIAYIRASLLPTAAMAFLSWPSSSEQRITTLPSHLRCLKLRWGSQQDSSKEESINFCLLY